MITMLIQSVIIRINISNFDKHIKFYQNIINDSLLSPKVTKKYHFWGNRCHGSRNRRKRQSYIPIRLPTVSKGITFPLFGYWWPHSVWNRPMTLELTSLIHPDVWVYVCVNSIECMCVLTHLCCYTTGKSWCLFDLDFLETLLVNICQHLTSWIHTVYIFHLVHEIW